jgi:hypothetical protein
LEFVRTTGMMENKMNRDVYWYGDLGLRDDFGSA